MTYTADPDNRIVHITLPNGAQIMRYADRGEWYFDHELIHHKLTMTQAVQYANPRMGGTHHRGEPGGSSFDDAVTKMLLAGMR